MTWDKHSHDKHDKFVHNTQIFAFIWSAKSSDINSKDEILSLDVQTRFETEAEVSLDRRFNLEKSELIPGEEGWQHFLQLCPFGKLCYLYT